MKIISWNVRGSNSQLKRRLLKRKIRIEKPVIVFLQETKCSGEDQRNYNKFFWKGAETMALDVNGATSGIGILWNPNLVSLSNFVASKNMILGHFHILGMIIRGVVTNVWPISISSEKCFPGRN